jgi:ERCC4-related helicase
LIKNFKPRLYQETIFATASQKNTLVVLPTGMGKTNIFLMLAAHRLKQYPESKVLLIGPTRPLIDQYYNVFLENFEIEPEKMAVFTGFVSPEKRHLQWQQSKIIFSTPQGLENDIISGKISLSEVSLLGVDEAHRATGDYSYVFIANQYFEKAKFARIVGMTASPGSEIEKIQEVIDNLHIEAVEIRSEDSPDVSPYIQELKLKYVYVEFPEEFKSVHKYLTDSFKSKLEEIKKFGYLDSIQLYSSNKREILALQGKLQGELAEGNREFELLRSISLAAEALKVQHAVELVETQGIPPLVKYLEQIENQAQTSTVKAVQNLMKDVNFRSAIIKSRSLLERNVEHPKITELRKIVSSHTGKKIIVFTQYRDTGSLIVEELSKLPGIKPVLFVGQAKKNGTGLTQKQQIGIIDKFSDGEYNVLVSSSVGEEGLDIPEVDLVLFYEPVPSAIRHIQRRGRTARLKEGEATILVTKGTRDEAYRWTAHHKEKRMMRSLETIKQKLVFKSHDRTLKQHFAPDLKIIADFREKASGVIKDLMEQGVQVELKQLESADYVCSSDCGIEFKTAEDFIDSLIDGRLLEQLKGLRQVYQKPIILVQGGDIYSVRNVHPNAVRGLLATITVNFEIPILFTKTPKDSANMLIAIARREQEEKKGFSPHGSRKPMTLREQQEYLVSSLPGIGPALAKPLLNEFGSVRELVNADIDKLKNVRLIGDKKAEMIRKVVDEKY